MQDSKDKLLEQAWGIIANAGDGNWGKETREWVDAACDFRDKYHAIQIRRKTGQIICLFLLLVLIGTRTLVPTVIDVSWTSIQKDVAHLVWGGLFVYTICKRDWWLFGMVWVVAFFELYMALCT